MHKIKNITFIAVLALLLIAVPLKMSAYAAPAASPTLKPSDCASGRLKLGDKTQCDPVGNSCAADAQTTAGQNKCLANNAVVKYLKLFINTLSAGVGIIVIAMIILGGIQYTAARDNAAAVTEAKKRITNAVIAMILYMLIFSFLQWLIPGGVFS